MVSSRSPKADGKSQSRIGMHRINQPRYPGEGAEQGERSEQNSAEKGGIAFEGMDWDVRERIVLSTVEKDF